MKNQIVPLLKQQTNETLTKFSNNYFDYLVERDDCGREDIVDEFNHFATTQLKPEYLEKCRPIHIAWACCLDMFTVNMSEEEEKEVFSDIKTLLNLEAL